VIVALVGVVWWPFDDPGFDRYHLPKELWLSACALALVSSVRLERDRVTLAALGLAALTCAATVFALTPMVALRGAGLVLVATTLFLSARSLTAAEGRLVRAAVVLGASVVAVVALGEVFGWWAGLSSTGRAPGATVGQRNMVAHLLLLVSPAAWTLAARERRLGLRVLALIAVALLAAGVLVTRSRAAWVTAPAVALGWWWFHQRTWTVLFTLGAAVALAASLTPRVHWTSKHPYAESFKHLVDAKTSSGHGRLVQYEATAHLVAQHPLLGVGPSNWLVAYPTVSPPSDPTIHETGLGTGRLVNSDWLALASEQGLVAVLVAALLAGLTVRRAWTLGDGPLALATAVALVGVGSFDAVLQLPAAVASAALILGTCARSDAPQPVAPGAKVAWALVFLFVTGFAALRLRGLVERARGGTDALEAALRWNPADLEARFELTEAYVLDGDCVRAAPHVKALNAALPHHARAREYERVCPP